MKFLLSITTVCLLSQMASAQNVGINSTGAAPDASAMLDLVAGDKGLLIPRVALTISTSALPITTPATSLMIYNTATVADVTPGYYYWDGAAWLKIESDGNGIYGGDGTTPAGTDVTVTDFINFDGNTMFIDGTNNRIGIGTTTPSQMLNLSSTGSANILIEADTDNAIETDQPQLQFSQDAGIVTGYLGYSDGTNHLRLANSFANADADIDFVTQGATRMTIDGVGNVGIGTTAPTDKLHVVGGSGTVVRIEDGNEALGRVLTSSPTGDARWEDVPHGGGNGATRPAFDVHQIGGPNYTPGQTIRYNQVSLNQGGTMNPATGLFTVPVNGLYHFTYSGISVSGAGTTAIRFIIDGVQQNARSYCVVNGWTPLSLATTRHLNAGQVVGVYVVQGQMHGNATNEFSGFLIAED